MMRVVAVVAIDSFKEYRFEGDSDIFDGHVDYMKSRDKRLDAIGFWLENWRYHEHPGTNHKSRVFIPWGSCLTVETLERDTND